MIALVFAVAALLLIIAIVLLVLDSRRKRTGDQSTVPAVDETTSLAHNQVETTTASPGVTSPDTASVQKARTPEPAAQEPAAQEPAAQEPATQEATTVGVSSVANTTGVNAAGDAVNSYTAEADLSAGQSEKQGILEATSEPQAESEPTSRQSSKLTSKPEVKQVPEPASSIEATDEPASQPASQTANQAASQPVSQAADGPADENSEKTSAQSTTDTQESPKLSDKAPSSSDQSESKRAFVQPQRGSAGIIAVEIPDGSKSHRRQRKAWAKERKADYFRIDRNLQSKWSFTPDGDAKAVVGGFSHGRQSYVFDVGNYTVIALRRSVASAERFELTRNTTSTLPKVAVEGGVLVSATTPALIHRIFDDRANAMLASIPRFVERMWSESNWVLAQLPRTTSVEHWEQTLDALKEFSNIARRLPPAEGEVATLDDSGWDPTRAQLVAHAGTTDEAASRRRGHLQAVSERESSSRSADAAETAGVADATGTAADEQPLDVDVVDGDITEDTVASKVSITGISAMRGDAGDAENWRPKRDSNLEPMNLPSRSVPRKMGEGDAHSQLQSQESNGSRSTIPALGEDPEHSRMRVTGGGIIRHKEKPASIFADSADKTDTDQTDVGKSADTTETD